MASSGACPPPLTSPEGPPNHGRGAQLSLFPFVAAAFASASGPVKTSDLYQEVGRRAGISPEDMDAKVPIGQSGQRHSPRKREIRWIIQTMKHRGILEKDCSERGLWRMTGKGSQQLRQALPDVSMLAFSTKLGLTIWGSWQRVAPRFDIPVVLHISSPPYPLAKPRAYGNPPPSEYVDFICRSIEPVVANLVDGASIVLNLTNDSFVPGTPARSTYLERLVIALEDRFGLSLMDRTIWSDPSKPPGPVAWASGTRQQLNVGYEHCIWMCNNPKKCRADNRRVLMPHRERHIELMTNGGEKRHRSFADGAYVLKPGSYGKLTPGRIPKNVLSFGHACADHREYRRDAAALGLAPHGAPMPLRLAEFWIGFLTEPGDMVLDSFGGKLTTGMAAERLGRKWIVVEYILDYIRAAAVRFQRHADGFQVGEWFDQACRTAWPSIPLLQQ